MAHPTFSVVIPTLEEESLVERAIRSAREAYGEESEILVVDGGSTDRTRELAGRHGRVLVRPGGRGAQLNAGAAVARGEILVFLHADTRVGLESGTEILRALSRPGVVGGCHRFRVDPPATRIGRFALLEAGVNLRTRLFSDATGDQAIFALRDRFQKVGGFPDYPLFEDIALVRRLRRIGSFELLGSAARTSRRRWERSGFWRTVALHWLLRAAFLLGASPDRLAAWYVRGRAEPTRSSSP